MPALPTFAWTALQPTTQALIIAVISVVLAPVASRLFKVIALRLTRRTETRLDDDIAEYLRAPVSLTLSVSGLYWATTLIEAPEPFGWALVGTLISLVIVSWTLGLAKSTSALLQSLEAHQESTWVTPRSKPLLDIVAKAVIYGGALYFVFLAWNLDVTGWLASAGVVGLAVGFAAQETLSSVIAGLFILTDAPYRIGDTLVLDTGERGRVTEIGFRTTRMMTLDDVQVVVPNSMMANAKIVNESGGPSPIQRLTSTVSVAYTSDIDLVREILLETAVELPEILSSPTPQVHFTEFGDSGLVFQLRVWIERPELRFPVLDRLNSAVFKRFGVRGIEIPYPKRDVYLHRVDGPDPDAIGGPLAAAPEAQ